MIDNVTNHETPSLSVEDQELEQLLGDAYRAPAPPRSLLQRIDRGVELEWGFSPQVASAAKVNWRGRLTRGRRWLSAAAAGVAAAVVLVVALNVNASGYAWADVLAAIAGQGVVQREGPEGVHWLSLSEGMLGEQTAESSRLLDLRRKVLLIRERGAAQVRRREVEWDVSPHDRDRLLVSFLRGDSLEQLAAERLAGLRIVDERWERRDVAGREAVLLQVQFETADGQRFTLQLTLDPVSQLPQACETSSGASHNAPFALSYPTAEASELREREFPAELAVVDRNDPESDSSDAAKPEEAAGMTEATVSAPAVKIAEPSAGKNPPNEADEAATLARLQGAASEWAPVVAVEMTRDEALQRLDSLLAELWSRNGVEPAAPAEDEELLRRVYLDLAGRTPTVSEVRRYLNDPSPHRYELLVDRLLRSPDHASHLATTWRTFLIPEGVDLAAFGGVEAFDRWLAERFAGNEGYDEVVRSLLLAEGRLSRSGPLLFYSAVKLDPDQLASRTARVFLGMRLECAQCHDHPFEPWSQQDFWSFAAFFAQISRPQAELESVSTVMRVSDINRGEVMLPDTETVVAPAFLDGTELPNDTQNPVRRQQLAGWLTSPENPYFARAAVNRVWGQMFGKGIVDPVDDFGRQNPPKSPELLDLLAGRFVGTKFDLRELFRTVAVSRAYRLSSGAPSADPRRTEWFAQMSVKMLTAEQVYDCVSVAAMLEPPTSGGQGEFQMARFGNLDREAFLQQFRTLAGRSTEYQGGIPQALTLMNGSLIEGATGLSSGGLLNSLEAPFFTNRQRVEVLYLATLSRHPRPAEWELLESDVPADLAGAARKERLADLLWALLNSAEFTMNH